VQTKKDHRRIAVSASQRQSAVSFDILGGAITVGDDGVG